MLVLKRSFQLLILAAMAVSGTVSAAEPFHPFAESLDFNPDWQVFAPVDVEQLEELHPRKRANHGWYVTYDRMHIGFDRPANTFGQSSKIDMTWGNRWDVGYMGEKDQGWLFSFTSVSGPNVYNDRRIPRLVQPAATVERFSALRPRFALDPNFGDGTFLERNSINVATLTNTELNKVWRLKELHYGGFIEPMVGLRWLQFNDYAQTQNTEFGNILVNRPTLANPFNLVIVSSERVTTEVTRTDNSCALGQIGFRYSKPINRLNFSQDLRVFAGQNFQSQGYRRDNLELGSDPAAGGGSVLTNSASTYANTHNSEFVVGTDIRVDAGYQFTKAFNIRAGAQLLYVGRGIWRGANPGVAPQNVNDQDIVSPAFTFGATFNR